MIEYEDMPIVVLTSSSDIGACPACGCNGAMVVGTGGWGLGIESKSWFRCYGCGEDWRAEHARD